MTTQPLTKLLNQKLPSQHSGEIIQKDNCWYVQMPTLRVLIGNSSESAFQYIQDLEARPEYALMQLVLDSHEFLYVPAFLAGGAS